MVGMDHGRRQQMEISTLNSIAIICIGLGLTLHVLMGDHRDD